MRSRPLTSLVFFVVSAVLCSGASGQSESGPAGQSENSLALRNWAVDFSPLSERQDESPAGKVAAAVVPSAASHFITMVPCRVVDTRRPDGAHGGPKLVQAGTRTFDMNDGPCAGIPANASAYSLSISVTQTLGNGSFLTIWPTGGTQPTVASVTWNEGLTLTTGAVLPAGTDGSLDVFSSKATHLIIDINGYFVEGVVTSLTPGTGTVGGGSGAVTLGIANGGVGAAQLGASAVTTGAIQDGAVTGAKIENSQVVRSVNRMADALEIVGGGGTTVITAGSTITVSGATGVPPGTMILGEANDTTLIAAGYTEAVPNKEDYWQATTTAGAPAGRPDYTAVWTGTKMIVWGGWPRINTGGRYDPAANSWTATSTIGAPSARIEHTAVWTGTRMIIWGGDDGTYANTGGQYDPAGNSWSATATIGAPSGRRYQRAVWNGSRMIVWGGDDGVNCVNTGGQFDPAGNSWIATNTIGAPAVRCLHSAVWSGSRMIIWGGTNFTTLLNTGGQYDVTGNSWSATSTAGAPSARSKHTAVWTGTKMLVWGSGGASTNTGGQYDPDGNSWSPTSTSGAPPASTGYSAVWSGTRMIVWGGWDDAGVLVNTGGQYNPASDSWSATTTNDAPSGRYRHNAVWTGTRMIIWGGFDAASYPNTGGRWASLSLYRKN